MFDKFKDTLAAKDICRVVAQTLHRNFEGVDVMELPVSDGGDGFLDCMQQILKGSAQRKKTQVLDPLLRECDSSYLLHGQTAYIEVANTAGL